MSTSEVGSSYTLWKARPVQKEHTMSDNLRRYRAIRDALTQGYPGQPTGTVARHLTTLAALISGIVGSQSTGRNEMDPPLCGSTAMSHNEFTIREPIEPQEASPMKPEMSILGIDIAKRVFHAVGMDERGKIVLRKRLSRHDLMPFLAKLPAVRIGVEACGGAHYWARRFREHGHEVKLMAPQFVKPYVKSNKNDSRDAEAIAEAVTRPTMRFVPIKALDQQDIQALHRVRERLIGERTALINEAQGR